MKSFQVGSKENERFSISIVRYEQTPSDDVYDNNWVASEITFSIGAFSGQYGASLTTQDFISFKDQLEPLFKTLKGEAKFETLEGQIEFTLTGNGRGGIEVNGIAVDRCGVGNQLRFQFEIDQTHLPSILRDLHEIISEFPFRAA